MDSPQGNTEPTRDLTREPFEVDDRLSMKQTKRKRASVVAPAATTTPAIERPVMAPPQLVAVSGANAKQSVDEDSFMTNGSNDQPTQGAHTRSHMYALTASCTVRDSIALKSALLDLLMDTHAVTIDVRAVERIDTAALQVLCAFVRDRKAAGGSVLWVGYTESFADAVRLLGLQQVLCVTDAQLIGPQQSGAVA